MNIAKIMLTAALTGLLFSPAVAEDIKNEVICAVVDVHICEAEEPCRDVQPSSINAPDFLKIDLKKKEIVGRRHDGSYGTFPIRAKEQVANMLMLQGMQEDRPDDDDKDDPGAWSVAIHTDTGRMAISVAGHEAAYVLFGNCHAL